MFLVRAATGVHGSDDGTGRRARPFGTVQSSDRAGALATCHVFSQPSYQDGRIVVYNVNTYPAYVVTWGGNLHDTAA